MGSTTESQIKNQLRLKHIGSFTLLFFLSVFRPAAIWPNNPIPLVPIALIVLTLLLFFKITSTLGFNVFWKKYKAFIVLVFAYQIVCFISLVINQNRYANITEFINWGLLFVAVQGALPLSILLFLLPQNHSKISITRYQWSWIIPVCTATLIPTVAIWQKVDNQSASYFYQYFIAGNLTNNDNVRSILAISTDLGAILALIFMASLLIALRLWATNKKRPALFIIALALLSLFAGFISEARNFFLMSATGIFAYSIYQLRYNKAFLFYIMANLTVLSVIATQLVPSSVASKLSDFAPFVLPLNIGTQILPSDLTLNFDISAFGNDRAELWEQAYTKVLENPLTGISNGGFRLFMEEHNGSRINNTHNFYVQAAVDAGVPGLLVVLVLLTYLLCATYRKPVSIFIFMCIVVLFVDNFLDHSLPWILFTVYLITNINHSFNYEMKPLKAVESSRHYQFSGCLLIILSIFSISAYQSNLTQLKDNSRTGESIAATYPFFADTHWHDSPTIMSKYLVENISIKQYSDLNVVHKLSFPVSCTYAYPQSYFIGTAKELAQSPFYRSVGSNWGISKSLGSSCKEQNNVVLDPEAWVSNHYQYFTTAGISQDRNELILRYDYVSFFSPIFAITSGTAVNMDITGNPVNDVYPLLSLTVFNGTNGRVIANYSIQTEEGGNTISIPLPPITDKVFIRLQPKKYLFENSTNQYHRINVRNIRLVPELKPR